jgi:hypothetical protein
MIKDRSGHGWRIHYGWRGRGDKFLAHVEDIKLAPHLYTVIDDRPAAPPVQKEAPAPPTPIVEPGGFVEEESNAPPPPPKRIDVEKLVAPQEVAVSTTNDSYPVSDNGFDWQKLPGVTFKIAQKLEGLDLTDVLEMGEEGLQQIEYVGPHRAKIIFSAAMEAVSV